ncbi:site-specific integrase [Candidatus Pacearchaeota archaeon]|nr:site-specific integrase [Candidatus Pacearchaeota archaeon]
MDKIDIHNTKEDYEKALVHLKKDVSKKNYELIKTFLDASAIGKTARKNVSKKQVGMRARLKNIFLIKVTAKFFKKDFDKLSVADMEKFVKALNENKIHKVNGKPYSEQTKSNVKITLILFLRYTIKDASRLAELTDWIETGYKKKEIPSLSEEEVKKLFSKCNTLQQKVLIAVLFDTGSRIEEFLNIRLADIIEVKGDVPYFKVTLREEFSKTQGRTIGLFWKPTTEILRQWLEEHPTKNKLDSQLFPSTYHGVRKVLHKIGKRALGKSVNPHLFRHSSATYYASQTLDYFQMCKRYGWSIGSSMPHTYIDRSGIKEKEFADKVINNNVKDLNEKFDRISRERNIHKEEMKNLRLEIDDLRSILRNKIKSN